MIPHADRSGKPDRGPARTLVDDFAPPRQGLLPIGAEPEPDPVELFAGLVATRRISDHHRAAQLIGELKRLGWSICAITPVPRRRGGGA